MPSIRILSLLLVTAASFVAGGVQQDPVRSAQGEPAPSTRPAPPPPDAKPLRPIEEPYVEPVVRADLPERYGVRDPIEGVWKVRARVVAGQPVQPGQGLLVIGRRHLVAHFEAPGPDARVPLLRSCAYTWSRADNFGMVKLVVDFGHYNDAEGDVTIEARGQVELRRIELMADAMRIHQDDGSYVEFVRAE